MVGRKAVRDRAIRARARQAAGPVQLPVKGAACLAENPASSGGGPPPRAPRQAIASKRQESRLEIDNKVVARYLDGRVLKGVTRDFAANRTKFHIEVDGTGEIRELLCRQLKALFFVRSFEGDPARQDLRGFVAGPAETAQGRKIAVRFADDEFICGYTLSWSPDREGFFLFPSDAGGNNQRIYVVTAGTAEVKAGLQAEAFAQRQLAREGTRPGGTGADAARQGDGAPAGSPHGTEASRPAGSPPRTGGQFTHPPAPPARSGTDGDPAGMPPAKLAQPPAPQRPPASDAA